MFRFVALNARPLALMLVAVTAGPMLPAAAQSRPNAPARYTSARVNYRAPDVTLIDMNGDSVSLPELLDGEAGPVVLQFIFTACRSSCPSLTAALASGQKQLTGGDDGARLISISIDPATDTPARLRKYAEEHHAGPRWSFFTGDPEDIVTVQKAFGVYHENMLRHPPTTLLRTAGDQPWLRLDGIIKATQLVEELESLRGGDGSQRR